MSNALYWALFVPYTHPTDFNSGLEVRRWFGVKQQAARVEDGSGYGCSLGDVCLSGGFQCTSTSFTSGFLVATKPRRHSRVRFSLLATLTGASDVRRRSIKGFMREHPELVQSSGGRRKPLKKLASPLTVLPPVVTPLSAEVRSLYR
jgi:hypothetical protein